MHPSYVLLQAQEGLSEMGSNLLAWTHLRSRVRPDPGQRLVGQTVIVTGANRTIGKCLTESLASAGARVVLACRDLQLAARAADDIRSRVKNADLVCYHIDLASFESVKGFVKQVKEKEERVDILINNAGVFTYKRVTTRDGYEVTIQVNYLAPVLLSLLLTGFMRMTCPDPRIIFLGSMGHTLMDHIKWPILTRKQQFAVSCPLRRGWRSYGHSKLALLLFVRRFRDQGSGVRVLAADPGICPTDFLTHDLYPLVRTLCRVLYPRPILRTIQEGANSVLMAVVKERTGSSDKEYYLSDGEPRRLSKAAQDEDSANRLWDLTIHILEPVMRDA